MCGRYALFSWPAALERMLARVCDAGVDMLHASTRRFWMPAFAGSDLTLAGWTRRLTGRPTTMVGNVGLKTADLTGDGPGSLRSVERLLAAGECDLVAVGRPLLGDAGWPTKVRDGRFAEIREHG